MKYWLRLTGKNVAHLPELARVAESAGFDGVMLPDHIVTPRRIDSRYPYGPAGSERPPWPPELPWPDPFVAFAAMAAVTTYLRFATYVLVAPMREPLTLAKQVATASALSDGRVALGLGVGWCREEFEILGHDFDSRGARLDEMIEVMRAVWHGGWVSGKGPSYPFQELREDPAPPGPVPIWIGGDGAAAFRRAVTVGDGWVGPNYPPEILPQRVAAMRRVLEESGRSPEGFELMVSPMVEDANTLWGLAELGLTGVVVAPGPAQMSQPGESELDESRAAIERFARTVFGRR
ncbi:MAG: TIGR03619 family F420-dependent LLM class oxidoreductase [Acidimicrobiales bacterium]|nr:TIGR03619 family F420-dependent LLM class oxidoreductase [Acidimicrobiales bacterium]